MKRSVFFVSDGTGITAETLGRSLLTQFEGVDFEQHTLPFVDSEAKAWEAVSRINQTSEEDSHPPIVFSTAVQPAVQAILAQSQALVLDFFKSFLTKLSAELRQTPNHSVGRFHGLVNLEKYKVRIDAVNYALECDDGAALKKYPHAEIILIGVSRCGKTPTSLYMALQFGLRVANYPFTEDDGKTHFTLPGALRESRQKLFGLTIEPTQLAAIRQERMPDSSYASLAQCRHEIKSIEDLFHREKIPFINTTTKSIEEIAAAIMEQLHIPRQQL
ncbi:MAG: phosphoenolpyruvate synthase regulatory protein [Gammaproteobacteria bacterium]|jgi:regulator of PEP synthase PpsR (kinase-PPPase family)|nr:phosphoenolpyruvate synthase regulatory protein [Gammaproteobacteria bacterium]